MSTSGFVRDVEHHLRSRGPTQDELDLFLLGQIVPPHPIPRCAADCRECWGTGLVCQCHGFAASYRHARHLPFERCRLSRPIEGRRT